MDGKWQRTHSTMFRKLLIPAAAALALIAGSGAASAKTYFDFNVGVGTPYYGGGYYGGGYDPFPYRGGYYGHRPYYGGGYGYRPHVQPCDPVVVGYRKVWSERRHRWIRKAITRCY